MAAFVAYAAAFVIYLAGSLASSIIPRPLQTELTEEQFAVDCRSSQDFSENCRGKFVIWDGELSQEGILLDEGAYRVALGDDKVIDLYGAELENGSYFDGMKVQFSGYLSKQNTMFDDVTDGRIESVLNSPQQVAIEREALEREQENKHCEKVLRNNRTMASIEAQCRQADPRVASGELWGSLSTPYFACVIDKQDEAKACGFYGPWN